MNPLTGIGLKIASVLIFVLMQTLVKAISHDIPAGQTMFFRSAFALPVIFVWLAATGKLKGGIATANPISHFWRGLVGTASMGLGFVALGLLPLPEATAISYAAPLLTVILAAMFLGEEVRAFRITAVGLGLVGVMIVLSPRLESFRAGGLGSTEALGAMIALLAALCAALAQVFVRKLVGTERTSAIVFWFSVNGALLSLLSLFWGWAMPTPAQTVMLVVIGLLGGVAQVMLTSAYRYADASVIAPFEYSSMLVALVVGYSVFGEVPSLTMLGGAALIVSAGILIILRERKLGLERSRQRRSMTPQG